VDADLSERRFVIGDERLIERLVIQVADRAVRFGRPSVAVGHGSERHRKHQQRQKEGWYRE
jgi:hypothetical protein